MTSCQGLYIWVEGLDDERFFEQIIRPLLIQKYAYIKIIQYARKDLEKKKNFLNSISSMNAIYIFIADIDMAECITKKKHDIQAKLGNLDLDKILIVIKEIESWYLAGLNLAAYQELGIRFKDGDTNNLTKEQFNQLIPKKFQSSRIDFMQELLKFFDLEVAKQNNTSFKYFCEKYLA